MPPPAEGLASRLVLGPALRTQPDRRLVVLVRQGYETAFEEIVRRYAKPLGRYATAIVGPRSEDVTQDAFSKALLALRRDDAEIELRPWLFRIVRNTALNDLRDSPPSPEVLAEALAGGADPAEEMERREELADLMRRLQALPAQQRAAIVMRELEGLGHDEIAAALGLSGGAARQAIYRARQALRDGLGMLLPLPLLRVLIDHAGEATTAGAAGAGAGGAIATAGASAGGAGAGGALKAGVVAAVLAGSVGTGAAIKENRDSRPGEAAASAAQPSVTPTPSTPASPSTVAPTELDDPHSGSDRDGDENRKGEDEGNENRGGGEDGGGPGPSDDDASGEGRRGRSKPPSHAPRGEDDDHRRHGSGHRGPGGGEPRPAREDDHSAPGRSSESRGGHGDGSEPDDDGSHRGPGSRHGGRTEPSPPPLAPTPPPPPAEAESGTSGSSDGGGEEPDDPGDSSGSGSGGDDHRDDPA